MTTAPSPAAIRPGRPADVPFVIDCIRALAEFENLQHQFEATEPQLAEHLFGDRPSCELLVADRREERCGYALFFTTYSTFLTRPGLFLEDLFVLPAARGQGLGRALLVELARIAVERGCGRLEWSVLDWNSRAIAFYESLGAAKVGGWIPYRVEGPALLALAARRT